MVANVSISNVKNVVSLAFEMPGPGVHLLTGRNGAGKTTLLASLYRIGYKNAFSDYFKTTSSSARLDSFLNASISYRIDNDTVSYNYGNSRWAPTPKRNATLLEKFGFPKVVFIAANAKRIEPSADDVNTIRPISMPKVVTSAIARVLADNKFDDLKYINTKRGGGNRAYLLPVAIISKRQAYYSEKNFSLGELCVIKLVNEINNIPKNSLVLIDEIEMALHPRAQVSLFDYLVTVAVEKSLTIIFSTHSTSLIKRAGRKKIIYLESDGRGNITSIPKCFPAQALGDIAIDEDFCPDVLCFVEDEKASLLLKAILDSSLKDLHGVARPVYKIVPVGGFKEVIKFLANSDQIFSDSVRRLAVLDKDVETDSLVEAKANNKNEFLAFYDRHKSRVRYLPCTPELGLHNIFLSSFETQIEMFKSHGGYSGFDISRLGREAGLDKVLSGANLRKAAKKSISTFVESVMRRSGDSEDSVFRKLTAYYVHHQELAGETFEGFGKEIALGST